MKRFEVVLRRDAWVNYRAVIEAETAQQAANYGIVLDTATHCISCVCLLALRFLPRAMSWRRGNCPAT
jgi:hypothetical protein